MPTYLAQNEFIPNSAVVQPPAVDSDGVGAKPILAFTPSEAATVSGTAPVAATLTHNAITQAVEIRPALPVSSEPSLPADAPTVSAGLLENELAQLIGAAGKRRRRPLALPRFAPDFPAIWKAMHDKSAPRAVLDPLWADASPIFLRDAGR